jgi:hypothetical protein
MARQRNPSDAVQFTYESAERIANVVRAAETTPPSASPLTFDRRIDGRMPKQVRAATFSGSWPIGGSKVVTFKYAPIATVNAVNLSWPITLSGYVNEDCVVGREGTNWWLVVPKLEARTAVFVNQTESASRITDVHVSATLNQSNCSIVIGKTLTTTSMTIIAQTATSAYVRLRVP